jgi:hypothetical protein
MLRRLPASSGGASSLATFLSIKIHLKASNSDDESVRVVVKVPGAELNID